MFHGINLKLCYKGGEPEYEDEDEDKEGRWMTIGPGVEIEIGMWMTMNMCFRRCMGTWMTMRSGMGTQGTLPTPKQGDFPENSI